MTEKKWSLFGGNRKVYAVSAIGALVLFLYIKNFNASNKRNPREVFPRKKIFISFEHDENMCVFHVI